MNRREMLKVSALAGAVASLQQFTFGQSEDGRARILSYLESLARPDGGYGWDGQERSHLTATFAVIGSYRLLNRKPPRASELAQFVRANHPGALKKLEQERRIFDWQQVQALVWLGEDPSSLREKILQWTAPLAYLKQYERNGYPLFDSEMGVILSRALLGVPANETPAAFIEYLESRRRANGSFGNTPASDGGDGHVLNTWWALQALDALGRTELAAETAGWLRSCQTSGGGFTHSPKPEIGGISDLAYTWAAVRGLTLLGENPRDRSAAIAWIRSLANSDGGFADHPGWQSNPMAVYYALDALVALDALDELPAPRARRSAITSALPSSLNVFSIQLEAHGRGSPAEAVDLAQSLRIHLWGAKNATPEWLARAQSLADKQNSGVKFFVSNEEYGTWVHFPGQGTYSHTSDIIAPAGTEIGPSLAGRAAVSWDEFRNRRLDPLERGKGRLVWQFGENEELVRMILDDSLSRGGFAAISTYHFGNPDFTNSEPFLHRWRGQIPFVALQDAHGPEPWWFADMTAGFRTLFLAAEPTWEAWLDALKQNRVVAVRRDQWTQGKTWLHGPSREIIEFVRARETDWRWWDNPGIQRPLISVVAIHPDDPFEAGRSENGMTIRVRCAGQNTTQGLLKQPLVEFRSLHVDDTEVPTEIFSKRRPNGLFEDLYHFATLPDLRQGRYIAKVTARLIATNELIERSAVIIT